MSKLSSGGSLTYCRRKFIRCAVSKIKSLGYFSGFGLKGDAAGVTCTLNYYLVASV